jgi:hypothetical protein
LSLVIQYYISSLVPLLVTSIWSFILIDIVVNNNPLFYRGGFGWLIKASIVGTLWHITWSFNSRVDILLAVIIAVLLLHNIKPLFLKDICWL